MVSDNRTEGPLLRETPVIHCRIDSVRGSSSLPLSLAIFHWRGSIHHWQFFIFALAHTQTPISSRTLSFPFRHLLYCCCYYKYISLCVVTVDCHFFHPLTLDISLCLSYFSLPSHWTYCMAKWGCITLWGMTVRYRTLSTDLPPTLCIPPCACNRSQHDFPTCTLFCSPLQLSTLLWTHAWACVRANVLKL